MKKRFFAVLLALALVVCLLPSTALAAWDYPVASESDFLDALWHAVTGDTITLIGNIDLRNVLYIIPAGVTVKGNHTLTLPAGANVRNAGSVSCSVALSDDNADFVNQGTVSGTVTVSSGNFHHYDGTVSGDVTVTGGGFQMGEFPFMTPTFTGSAVISGGEFWYGQDFTVAANKSIAVSGAGAFYAMIQNAKVTLSAGASIVNGKASGTVSFTLSDGTAVTLQPGSQYSMIPVAVSPAATFLQGNAPQIVVTIGEGVAGLGLDNLGEVAMDEQVLTDGDEFTASDGSIVLTLSQDYLNTLTPGTHTLTAQIASGACAGQSPSVRIVVNAPADIPATGDGATPLLWLGLLLLAGAGLLVLRKRRRA